jgi:hypothetical protein
MRTIVGEMGAGNVVLARAAQKSTLSETIRPPPFFLTRSRTKNDAAAILISTHLFYNIKKGSKLSVSDTDVKGCFGATRRHVRLARDRVFSIPLASSITRTGTH